MKNQLFAALLGVIAFTSGYAQEQLSFVDNHERAIYKTAYFYESDDTVRYLTEENDGTITIAEYNGETFDTLLYLENLDNALYSTTSDPLSQQFGNYHIDFFTHEMRLVNVHTLETRFIPIILENPNTPNLSLQGEYLVTYNSPTILNHLETGELDTLKNFIFATTILPPDAGNCNFCICGQPTGTRSEILNDSVFISVKYNCNSPENIYLYDFVNDNLDAVSINRPHPVYLHRNLVLERSSIYSVLGVDDYNLIATIPDSSRFSSKKLGSKSLIQAEHPSGDFDLHTYNSLTQEVTSLFGLPDSLRSINDIIPSNYFISSRNREPDLLYNIKKDTCIIVGDVRTDVLLYDYYYFTIDDNLYRLSLSNYETDTLGTLNLGGFHQSNLNVIPKDNKLFITVSDFLYIHDDIQGLVPVYDFTYDVSGFRDMDLLYYNETFYNTERRRWVDTLTYKYNRSDFELISDYRLLELPDISPVINNNLWVSNARALGIEVNNQISEVLSGLDMSEVDYYTSLDKDYLFVQDNREKWLIDTKSLEAKKFNMLNDYRINNAFSLGHNFIFSTENIETDENVNWIYYPENNQLIRIEDFSPYSDNEFTLELNNVTPLSNDKFFAIISLAYWPDISYPRITVCHLIIISPDGTIQDLGRISCSDDYEKIVLNNDEYIFYDSKRVVLVDSINGANTLRTQSNSSIIDVVHHNNLLYVNWINDDNGHYIYDRVQEREVDLNLPSNTILKNFFTVGESLFGYLLNRDNGDTYFAKIDSVDVTRIFDTEPLGNRQSHYVFDEELNIPAKLALINMPGIGSELFLLYEDGSLELLTDLNEGPSSMNDDKADIAIIDGNLFFEGITQESGKQLYGMPVTFDFLSSTSEINEDYYVPDITIYPNPTQEVITISGNENVTAPNYVKIINSSGDEVFSQIGDIEPNKQITVSSYPAGTYYVLIDISNRTFVKPFVKI